MLRQMGIKRMRRRPRGDLRRRGPIRNPRKKIIVYCEGKNTEPAYIYSVCAAARNPLVDVEALGRGMDPSRLVEEAIQRRSELMREARRNGSSFDSLFEVWAMFDVDEHAHATRSQQHAATKNVNVALSNPCFELWGLYHVGEWHRPISRQEAQRELARLVPSYSEKKIFRLQDFAASEDALESLHAAIRHSARGIAARVTEGDPHGCPSSSCHELFEAIVSVQR